jgi:hypothetical protein
MDLHFADRRPAQNLKKCLIKMQAAEGLVFGELRGLEVANKGPIKLII